MGEASGGIGNPSLIATIPPYISSSQPMGLNVAILPVVTKDLPISPRFTPYEFLSPCKVNTLATRQPMVEFDLLTLSAPEGKAQIMV